MPDPLVGGLAGPEPRSTRPRAPHYAALLCEIDAGGRFTFGPSGDSQRPSCLSAGAAACCGTATRWPSGHTGGQVPCRERPPIRRAWYGFGRRCVFTPLPPVPLGSLPNQQSVPEGRSKAPKWGRSIHSAAAGSSGWPITPRAHPSPDDLPCCQWAWKWHTFGHRKWCGDAS